MRKNYYAVLLVLAMVAVYAVAQSASTPGNQGTWSEKPPSVGQVHQRTSDSGADRDSIQRLVEQQLQSDPALSDVKAEVSDHDIVTLTGTVASKNDRDHAKQLAESVPGVRKVKEKIKIGGGAPASASGGGTGGVSGAASSTAPPTTAQSGAGTSGSVGAPSQPSAGATGQSTTTEQGAPVGGATATVGDDRVELTGTVQNGKEKQTARRIAESYAGNRNVVDHIKVTGQGAMTGPGAEENNPYGGSAPSNPNAPTGNPNNPTNPSPTPTPPHR